MTSCAQNCIYLPRWGSKQCRRCPAVLAFCHDPIMGVLGVAALLVWAPPILRSPKPRDHKCSCSNEERLTVVAKVTFLIILVGFFVCLLVFCFFVFRKCDLLVCRGFALSCHKNRQDSWFKSLFVRKVDPRKDAHSNLLTKNEESNLYKIQCKSNTITTQKAFFSIMRKGLFLTAGLCLHSP